MDKAWKAVALVGIGYASWMLYKKYMPECAHDIKTTMSKITNKATKTVENMM